MGNWGHCTPRQEGIFTLLTTCFLAHHVCMNPISFRNHYFGIIPQITIHQHQTPTSEWKNHLHETYISYAIIHPWYPWHPWRSTKSITNQPFFVTNILAPETGFFLWPQEFRMLKIDCLSTVTGWGVDKKPLSYTHRIHGTGIFSYMKTININHSCRYIYQSHGWYGIYEHFVL